MRLDQFPIGNASKPAVNMLIGDRGIWPIHGYLVPVTHSREQFNPQQMSQTKDHFRLALCICMNGIRLQHRFVLQDAIKQINRFPDTAGNETTEKGDIGIRNVMMGDTPIAAIANMSLTE
jgi:hypothetical protein